MFVASSFTRTVRDGSARLDGIDHQHELVDCEITSLDGVFDGIALIRLHVYELAQRLDVVVDAFVFGRHAAVFRQPSMICAMVRLCATSVSFLQNLQEVQISLSFSLQTMARCPLSETRRICTAS